MKQFVMFVMGMFLVGLVLAEGGKVQEANPVFDEDGNPIGIVQPADCEQYGSLQSGKVVWFCEVEDED